MAENTVTLRVWYRHSLTERHCDNLAEAWQTAQYLKDETYDYGVPEDILIDGVVAYKLGADDHWVRVNSAAPAIPTAMLEQAEIEGLRNIAEQPSSPILDAMRKRQGGS